MSRLRWKKSTAGKPHDDFRDNGHRPPDELQRRADAAFAKWAAKLSPRERAKLTKRPQSVARDFEKAIAHGRRQRRAETEALQAAVWGPKKKA